MADYKKQKSHLSIYTKYVEFIMYTNNILSKYPKRETFALASEIRNAMYKGLENLIFAIKSFDSNEKIANMRSLDIQLALLKIQIRISFKLKYISLQNYESWCEYLADLSNMLGGWINHVKKNK